MVRGTVKRWHDEVHPTMRGAFAVMAVAAAVVLGACGDSAEQHASAASSGDCQPDVRYDSAQGSTGFLWAVFTVKVTSTRGCTFRGFPGIRLVDGAGRRLPTHPHRAPFAITSIPDRPVILRRDRPGRFLVTSAFLQGDGRYCRPLPHAIVVSIPGYRPRLTVPVDRKSPDLRVFTPCDGAFGVSPVGI